MTFDYDELLGVCIQDLAEGRRQSVERLPDIGLHAGSDLRRRIEDIARAHAMDIETFKRLGMKIEGPDNLWMRGIIEDALRDTRSVAAGDPLDVALIGAVRKAIMADFVSLETALLLATALGRNDLAEALEAMRGQAQGFDTALRIMLEKLART